MRSNKLLIKLILIIVFGTALSTHAQKTITDISKSNVTDQTGMKVAFSAKITQPRNGTTSYGDANLLRRFEKVEFNDGKGFEPTTGVFTTPVSGYYCFIFNINLSNYGCYNFPLYYSVTLVRNGSQEIETFFLNVEPGPGGFTSQGFTFFTQLNAKQTISIKPNAPLCPGGRDNIVNSLSFSGFKIY